MSLLCYTYDADYYCAVCAKAQFGTDDHGFVPEDAKDSEGNKIGAVFTWDEWYNFDEGEQQINCADCTGFIAIYNEGITK